MFEREKKLAEAKAAMRAEALQSPPSRLFISF